MTAAANQNSPIKSGSCKSAPFSSPGGGRTFLESRKARQSEASATQPCGNTTERCVNLTIPSGEKAGNAVSVRSPADLTTTALTEFSAWYITVLLACRPSAALREQALIVSRELFDLANGCGDRTSTFEHLKKLETMWASRRN